jgi:maltose alpha-D-glucosyltransferase / alpha-amylase
VSSLETVPHPEVTASAPTWYQRAVIYEVHVRAFYDSDDNGNGDFAGLIEKLDYVQDLGVTTIWLLPFCPSPGRDDGYDISDYVGVHPAYGCLDDFRRFLDECKRRDLRVITELVLNHTSDQHPWFQCSRLSPPGSRWRDYYVWSDTPGKYAGVRIIFNDFETSNWTWDEAAGAYYFHRFYSHQPDLNFDSPDVRQSVFETVDFWFSLGVDGLRLDAAPYLFEREGTNCENLPETHAFLRQLRSYVDSRYKDRMLLAEANQWPEDAVAYFGSGDECHMAFNFPLMPRLFLGTRMEDSFPIVNIIRQTPDPPEGCQWATFLRNHDELTLEMVCDEERDYLYRMYAQEPEMRINVGIRRRLAPLLGNDRRRITLMNALLFSLPGTPVIYYGDEIGMGEILAAGDRNSVRTPMQWSARKNAGFSAAEPDALYLPVVTAGEYAYDFVNVESQLQHGESLLWWTRHALSVRRNSDALTAGGIEFLSHRNRHVLAFVREGLSEDMLVVANLSRYSQPVQLPLGSRAGCVPVEVFGRVDFPPVTSEPYQLSLTPYGFYWFRLRKPESKQPRASSQPGVPVVEDFDWEDRATLASLLTPYLGSANVSHLRRTTHAEVIDLVPFENHSAIAIVRVWFTAGDPELQLLPLTTESLNLGVSERAIAAIRSASIGNAALCIHASNGAMSDMLLDLISREGELRTSHGVLRGVRVGAMPLGSLTGLVCLRPGFPEVRQRNTSVILSDLYVLKMFRHLETGSNADISTVRFLFEEAAFSNVAPVFGKLEYVQSGVGTFDAGVLHAYVDSRADLWRFTINELSLWLGQAAAAASSPATVRPGGAYVEICRLLGRRTAEMHLALMGPPGSEFAPEPFDQFSRRGAFHSMSSGAEQVLQALVEGSSKLADVPDIGLVIERLESVGKVFASLTTLSSPGLKIHGHGDFHLGQVLHTGDDLVFIDFEGDNSRPLSERALKISPVVDVAGMLHSFRYAAASVRFRSLAGPFDWHGYVAEMPRWIEAWYETVSDAYISEYRGRVAGSGLVPADEQDFNRMLHVYLVAKAVYQIGYDLQHRPDWLPVALRAFLDSAHLDN